VAVTARHDGGGDGASLDADEKELALHAELARDVLLRVIPCPGELAALPKADERRFVLRLERPDVHPYFAPAV